MKNTLIIFSAIIILFTSSCDNYETGSDGSIGTGGSLARFTIAKNALYIVNRNELKIFNINNIETPVSHSSDWVGFGAETLFPLDSLLFMGTETGMGIYDISNPLSPKNITWFSHIRSCDPVVSDGNWAYITLRSDENRCNRGVNELQIVDIRILNNPILVSRLNMDAPKGLAIRNDTLYVCDNGLNIIDVTDKQNPVIIKKIQEINANDIIINNDIAIVMGLNELNQYKIENGTFIKLSSIKTKIE